VGEVRSQQGQIPLLVTLYRMADVADPATAPDQGQFHLWMVVPEEGKVGCREMADEEKAARAGKCL
jgi:hypothetical protein